MEKLLEHCFQSLVIVLFVTTIALGVILVFYTKTLSVPQINIATLIVAVLTLIVSLASSVLGGVLAKRWDDFT
jgi:nucleoside recognition membrane protein YjiH